ncbi:MAG: hypothetical protein R2856_22765 [Caldilineaceae bacterium]
MAYGSDWPVVSQDPVLGLYAGMNRMPWQAGDPFQAQTLANLIRGYTFDAAYAEFQEAHKGMIKPRHVGRSGCPLRRSLRYCPRRTQRDACCADNERWQDRASAGM